MQKAEFPEILEGSFYENSSGYIDFKPFPGNSNMSAIEYERKRFTKNYSKINIDYACLRLPKKFNLKNRMRKVSRKS